MTSAFVDVSILAMPVLSRSTYTQAIICATATGVCSRDESPPLSEKGLRFPLQNTLPSLLPQTDPSSIYSFTRSSRSPR